MPRKKNEEEAQRWFLQARYDVKAAIWNRDGGFYDTVCFLSQQSAEKAFKSLLYYQGRRQKLLSHSVVELVKHVEDLIPKTDLLLEAARKLDLHYIPSRYPNGLPSGYPHQFYSKETAEEAIKNAKRLLDAVESFYRLRKCTFVEEEATEVGKSEETREPSEMKLNEESVNGSKE